MSAAAFGNHDFEIFTGHHQRCGAGNVAALKQRGDVFFERVLPGRIERRECLVRRSVEIAKNPHPVRGGVVTELEVLAHRAYVGGLRANS